MLMTPREVFLLNIQAYLIHGGRVYSDNNHGNKRTFSEVEQILNTRSMFVEIDILKDELDYYGLSLEDFTWNE